MTYEAIVVRAKTRPHPNADRLQLADVGGYQVVVGLDVEDGQLGVFFPPDGQISEEMATANDLVGYTDPETGERKGGFFPKNRRVKSQKFRGEKSEGYWTPLASFEFVGIDPTKLQEGERFSELNGIPICNKYYTPATIKAMRNRSKMQQRQNFRFAKHVETEKFQYVVDQIPSGSLIYITEKLHGTSNRFGYVLDEKEGKRTWRDKLLRRPATTFLEYDHMIGTRNVILGKHEGPSFYGSEEFRYESVKDLEGRLHKGEILYYEIVGYTHENQPIMGDQDTTVLKDKEVTKKYGPKMRYSYGCKIGSLVNHPWDIYVYRITRVNEDGEAVELSWPQVKDRCRQLFIKHVPELVPTPYLYYKDDKNNLMDLVAKLTEGPSTIDDSHIREGVVLRVERPNGGVDFIKSKSFTFGVLEGFWKESDDAVDLEEVS